MKKTDQVIKLLQVHFHLNEGLSHQNASEGLTGANILGNKMTGYPPARLVWGLQHCRARRQL